MKAWMEMAKQAVDELVKIRRLLEQIRDGR